MLKLVTFLFIILSLLSGCLSTQNSNKQNGEVISIQTDFFEKPLSYNDFLPQDTSSTRGLISLDLLLGGFDFAFDGVKKMIVKHNSKYQQSYQQSRSNNKFYANTSTLSSLDPSGLSFRGFSLAREIRLNKNSYNAMNAHFSLDTGRWTELYNQSKFYLKCDSVELNYSKCKLNQKTWFLPWTLFGKKQESIHFSIEIEIFANWIDFNGTIRKNQSFGKFYLNINDFNFSENKKYNVPVSGFSYLPPRSASHQITNRGTMQRSYGLGDFSIVAKVTESSKQYKFNQILLDNTSVIDQIEAAPIKSQLRKKITN